MTNRIELEDTFADIVGKACSGHRMDLAHLAKAANIERGRLEQLVADKTRPSDAEAHAVAKALQLHPEKLADSGQRRWFPEAFAPPDYLHCRINAPHPSNGYVLILRDVGVGAVVDPAGAPAPIIEALKHARVNLQYLLVTHKHYDHADALKAMRTAFRDASVVMHELDARELSAARGAIGIRDGERLPFGNREIATLHTPGHTDGSSCFLYQELIFTGDTMFAGSIGRTNGPSFDYEDHRANIRLKILSLPPETVVLPGHGPPSTVAQEQAHNPFF